MDAVTLIGLVSLSALYAFTQVALHKFAIWFVHRQINAEKIQDGEHAERVVLSAVWLITFLGAFAGCVTYLITTK